MDALTLKINLDCLRKDSQAIINAKVGEANGRKVVFTLYEGRTAFFVPAEATVIFRAQKPDGTILYNNCVIDDGKVEYTITSQTVAVAGVYACELQIVSDGRIIYSPYVTLNVMDNLYADTEVESSNEFTELENALNKIPPLEVIYSKYTKPEGGIPKADLANDVQASLNKADTALQEHQSLVAYRTASEQDIIDSTKQDKLTAGDNITIAADGTISSTGGGAKAFFLNVFVITETQIVTNKTYAEIKAAIDAGDIIYITDKDGVVYVPQVAKTGTKIEFLWFDSHEDRTYRWSAVVNSENVWSVTIPELATTDEIGNLAALKTQADDNLVAAINEVKQTTDTKQDKLIAGDNITIAADGKTISATGGGGSTVELDTTLSAAGKAADAKAVGDALAGKQNTISDLESIRTGAAKGATALQSVPSTYRTALAQDVIDSDLGDRIEVIEGKEAGWNGKQDKLIAGDNITIAADGKTISAKGSSGALIVHVTDNNGTLSADKTYIEIRDAIVDGIPVVVDYGGMTLPFIAISDSLFFGTIVCENDGTNAYVATATIEITENGEVHDISTQIDIPKTLPNPHALTFTGAVTGSYDGSAPVSVEIPSAVTDAHINSLIDTKLGVIENGSY